jgi:hypothetical protein
MEAVAGSAAYGEAIGFLGCFRDFPDPRQRGKVIYPLEEVLLLCLLAVLAGAETFVDIARFGQKKIAFLRRFLPFRDGTPSHDHLGDIFATLDDTEFQRRFVAWVAKLIGVSADLVAIDGKTLRGSAHKKGAFTTARPSQQTRGRIPGVILDESGDHSGMSCPQPSFAVGYKRAYHESVNAIRETGT